MQRNNNRQLTNRSLSRRTSSEPIEPDHSIETTSDDASSSTPTSPTFTTVDEQGAVIYIREPLQSPSFFSQWTSGWTTTYKKSYID